MTDNAVRAGFCQKATIAHRNTFPYHLQHPRIIIVIAKGDDFIQSDILLISNGQGKAVAFALFGLQDRGKLFLGHGAEVYEGQIIGIHSRSNDLTVNCLTGKKLTNMRASGTDEAVVLVPPIRMTLEQALEFIDDDELVEVTPTSIRIRKRHLTENDRRRANRAPKDD